MGTVMPEKATSMINSINSRFFCLIDIGDHRCSGTSARGTSADRCACSHSGREACDRRTHQGPRDSRSKAIWKVTPSTATCSYFCRPATPKKNPGAMPVVYALHGYSIGAEQWSHEIHVPQTIEGAFAQGAKEMIVVLPDSKTLHNGSMYSSSVTTGDFEQFIAHDLVAYIDAHYRTIPNRLEPWPGWPLDGRLRRDPDRHEACRCVWQPVHHESVLLVAAPQPANPEIEKALEAVKTPEDSAKLSFFPRAQLATAAAWSPNPKNPPLYLDLPTKDGEPQPDVIAKWAANAPLAFVDQYIGNLRSYRGIAIDVGDQDGLRVDTGKLHDVLDKYGIANSFEIYPGTHTSKVADRFQNHVMPFFSQNLCFQTSCQ